ncbi:GNAT family N-acetyltransferase [Sneathiella sp. P13V-1]|uniref:GNAT family N-acetyltransferase n=1 Tax=Sneathiella sp. P13V-1 TaxID=2697366 RepID=UPI00187BAB3F|nr:GNAT family N-acetyltransferase [Sneathiella sp. P13V-1]MBE7638205.1 GNAT family N-acetyltransferase [Sneathiella sp. P13V-1]
MLKSIKQNEAVKRKTMIEGVNFKDTYVPGLMGEVVSWHGRYYSKHWGFGPEFEAIVASGISEFSSRMDTPKCRIFSAWQNDIFLGSVSVDNDGDPDQALGHIRWFIMSDDARGRKIGRPLFTNAINFIRQSGYEGSYLTTFKGLEAATKLYVDAGYTLTHEAEGNTWGTKVVEQRFDLMF